MWVSKRNLGVPVGKLKGDCRSGPGARKTALPPDRRLSIAARIGAVAQLGERVVRNDEVRGSIPLGSTSLR